MTPDHDYGAQTSYTLQLFFFYFSLLCSYYATDMIKRKLELRKPTSRSNEKKNSEEDLKRLKQALLKGSRK